MDPGAVFHRRCRIIEALQFEEKLEKERITNLEVQRTMLEKQIEDIELTLVDHEYDASAMEEAIACITSTLSKDQLQVLANNAW